MVTICVDGGNKTRNIIDWSLWTGKDDGNIMLTCHFRSGKKYTRPLSVCQITPTLVVENVFLEHSGRSVTSQAERIVIYGNKYAAVYYPKKINPTL